MTEGLGRNPTDRGRSGGKIHLHVDAQAISLGVTVTGAKVHDSRLIEATQKNSREMAAVFWELPYAISIWGSEEVYVNGFKEHIRSRKKEVWERWENPARCWVVERAFARLKTFRSLRTRYCYFLANLMGSSIWRWRIL